MRRVVSCATPLVVTYRRPSDRVQISSIIHTYLPGTGRLSLTSKDIDYFSVSCYVSLRLKCCTLGFIDGALGCTLSPVLRVCLLQVVRPSESGWR